MLVRLQSVLCDSARAMILRVFFLLVYSAVGCLGTFTDQPRLQTIDGHLFIYGGTDKNVTFMTTDKGYINVNGENLYNVVQNAKKASRLLKTMKYTALSKLEEDMNTIIVTLEQYSQRLNVCESMITSKSKDKSYYPMMTGLNSRVSKLERKVRIISRNLRKNECRKDPCLNGGTCLDRYLGYECRCTEGWEGKNCEKDVNECAKFAGTDLGCQNGATCHNKIGSYECHCAPGWYGLHCLRRSNDCDSASAAELCGNGVCVTQTSSPRGYACICSQGWKTDGVTSACTVDVDECSTFPCSRSPPVSCHNSPGSFFCGPCPPGYTGNGFQCSDVNECLVDNGGCSLEPLVTCINKVGSSTCGPCPPGYSGDGRTCIFVGKCRIDNGGCHPNAHCLEVGSNVQCQCVPGFTGHGVGPFGCQALSGPISTNPCQPNPCKYGGQCYSFSEKNFTCVCRPGFRGPTCSSAASCDDNPCQHGGTCETRGTQIKCKCSPLYRGTFCEERREDCGEFIRADDGFLSFPDEGSESREHSCSWVIRVNATRVITITFDSFNLKSSFECQLEWLEIHDGRSTSDATIGKFCGSSLPNNGTIVTSQNNVYIWFKSVGSISTKFQLLWNATEPICGGLIDASVHGIITSPGYPGKYPNGRNCFWEMIAPVAKRIMFTIFDLRLNSGPSCLNDFVEIRESLDPESPLLAKFCNRSSPEVLETPGNAALVHFHSDARGTDKGFQIGYHPKPGYPGCGGIFTTLRGEISPPLRNNLYLPNMDCAWVIRLPENRRVKIEFLEFAIQQSRSCRDDFVEVRDGGDVTSSLLGKFCGQEIPPPISSNQRTMFIRFYSDDYVENSGFRIRYKSACDEVFTDDTGIIKSPGYPKAYKNEEECVMIIQQPTGKIIHLEFQDFEMESTYKCIFDYLEIRDGHSEQSPLIGRYCGEKRPGRIVSSHNYLYLKIVTDTNVELSGFYANYTTVDVSCGGIHTAPTGVINSPIEGNMYPSNAQCKWVIATQPGQLIQLTFNKFKVEGFPNCGFDYVEVFDYSADLKGNNLMGRYCNINPPPVLTSSDNMMTIVFESDSVYRDEGFSAMYTTFNGSDKCGGKFFTEWGVIKTPNYPSSYPHGANCEWVIHVKTGHKINLNVTDFFLEAATSFGRSDKECRFDYLEIRDGGYSSSPLIGRYCGTVIPKQILSQSNNLFLKFVSDHLDSRKGFQIFWDGSIKGCGGSLTGFSGRIMSPNYPENYGALVNCMYKVSVANGNKVQINFIDIDLQASRGCSDEFIEILDGQDLQSTSLGKFCSASSPPTVISSSNHVTIVFKSGIHLAGKGFYLKYFTVCHSNTTGYRGVIESPNYPSDYPSNLDCMWTIRAPRGNKVSVSFADFTMKSMMCWNSHLEVKESSPHNEEVKTIGIYCKKNKTQTIESTMEWLTLHFVTSEKPIGGNFRLEWSVKGCGGYLTKPSATFTSPNYPNLYPTDTHCEWWITVDPMESISLVISDISMEKAGNCELDFLEVYGGPDSSSPLLTKVCGVKKEPITVTSSGNKMYVFFKSEVSNVGRGFTATYRSTPIVCGGLFTSDTGTIHSRNYPKNYQSNDNCEWTIRVDANHRINLTFVSFDVTGGYENCSEGVVEVYDGPNINYPFLWSHCGNYLHGNNTVISTSNYLTVRMEVTDLVEPSKGFLATYSKICGGVVNADEYGTIEGGGYLNSPERYNCSWLITTSKPDGHVILTLPHIVLNFYERNDRDCFVSRLMVFDGPDDNSTLVGTYCNNISPLPIVSRSNQLYLLLVLDSDWTSRYGRFLATYKSAISACGGELMSNEGSFASPNYPNSYPPQSECVWIISSAPGNKVQLNFKVFEMNSPDNCNDEYLEIRNESPTGKLLGVYCATNSPSNLTAHNALWVKFKSKGGSMRFLADYALVYENELNGTSGSIASPGYPNLFARFLDPVTWRITVDLKMFISIKFKELFIDATGVNECSSSLTIYDGFDATAPILARLCDAQKPEKAMVSSSNVVFISFNCEPYNLGSMFYLDWMATKTKVALPSPMPTSTPVPGCGGEFSLSSSENSSVVITIPTQQSTSTGEMKCIWKVTSPELEHLSISFRFVDMTALSYCESTNILIETELDGAWKELAKICGKASTNKTIHGNTVLKITYTAQWFVDKSPASMYIRTGCGSYIRKTNGIINFDWKNFWGYSVLQGVLVGKSFCQWVITVTPGRTIRPTFFEFNGVGNTEDGICRDQYVSLRNGATNDSPFLGKGSYCSLDDVVPKTSSNKLLVKVVDSYRSYGFTLMFKEVSHECGGKFTLDNILNSTVISSPNFPNVPPMKIECTWRFVTTGVRSLQIDFTRFDISYSYGCALEYVSVRDGGTELSEELGRFCGSKPSTVKTTGNMMLIRFFTNTTDPSNGFRATVSLSRCGGIITSSSGTLTSPGYPVSFPYQTKCHWEIETNSMSTLKIKFEDISLPVNTTSLGSLLFTYVPAVDFINFSKFSNVNSSCDSTSSLVISEPMSTSISPTQGEALLALICSNTGIKTIRTSKNKVTIAFDGGAWDSSHYLQNPRGFKLSFTSARGGCVHKLFTESGVIESPKHSIGQLGYYNCEWKITVPLGRRITVTVVDSNILWFPPGAVLLAYNDHGYRSQIGPLFPKSGSPLNNVIKSTANLMTISFVSPSLRLPISFTLTYNSDEPAVCGGRIENSEGTIVSPTNVTSFYCPWDFVQKPEGNQTLSLTVYDSIIGNRTGTCTSKFGSFLSFKSEAARVVRSGKEDELTAHTAILCGNVTSQTIRTPFINAKLKGFKSHRHFGDVSFNIKYKISPCGGLITGSEFTLTSPNYPSAYPNDTDCSWLLDLPFDSSVKLTIEDFQLDTKSGCTDYLLIKNGPNLDSPLIEKFCGTSDVGKSIVTETSSVLVEFHSDSTNQERGFRIKVESVNSSCGGIVHTQDAYLSSPGYPTAYDNNQECEWEIRAVEGMHIGLVFTDRFHIEDSDDCKKDYIKVFDYVNGNWSLLKTLCGREFPEPINSTSNKMKILFHSDDSVVSDGFRARWYSNCGAKFSKVKSGRIMTPGYPGRYPNDVRCEYIIHYPSMEIDLNFRHFNLEKGSQGSCTYDSVEIFQKSWTKEYKSLGTYCGSTMPPKMSIYEEAKVVFITDTFVNLNGFVLDFGIDECEEDIREPTEINYKYGMRNHMMIYECRWNITAPEDKVVVLRFTHMNFPFSVNCEDYSLKVVETDDSGSEVVVAKLCGRLHGNLPTIRSKGNRMDIRMSTSLYDENHKFSAIVSFSYSEAKGCGGSVMIDTNPVTLQSPDINKDGMYEELLDCSWSVFAKPYHYIVVDFVTFDVDNCDSTRSNNVTGNCSCDFVELRNGLDPTAEILATACGNVLPPSVVSSGNAVTLRLVTDAVTNGKGFSIRFSGVMSECGFGQLDAKKNVQTLSSPNYPENFPLGIRCKWVITDRSAPLRPVRRKPIHVFLVEWDMGESDDCSSDALSLRNTGGLTNNMIDDAQNVRSNQSVIIVGKSTYYGYPFSVTANDRVICGRGRSFDYYSFSNEVTIDFVSKGKVAKKGFLLEYSLAGCSRNYSSDHGQIIVGKMKAKETCEIVIEAPTDHHTIALYFYFFSMFYVSSDCPASSLEVRDGRFADSPVIVTTCGSNRPGPIFSSGRYLRLKVSNADGQNLSYYGHTVTFDASFTTTDQGVGCGGRLSAMAGVIYSPEYPKNLRESSLCRWDFSVPKDMEIAFKFINFDIGSSNICDTDYLAIFDVAPDGTENLRSKLCGESNPAIITSQASGVAVKYSTSVHNGGTGWEMEYKIVLPGTTNIW